MSERRESRIADFLDRCADVFFKYAVPPNVMDWPTWARRAFLLTLPASLSLWLAWWAAFIVALWAFAVGAFVLFIVCCAAAPFAWAVITIREIWEA